MQATINVKMNELAFEQMNEGNNNVFMNELGILHE